MKAKSIEIIRGILKKERDDAYKDYKYTKDYLEEKYQTDWIDNKLSDSEMEELREVKIKYYDLNEVYEDFEKHDW